MKMTLAPTFFRRDILTYAAALLLALSLVAGCSRDSSREGNGAKHPGRTAVPVTVGEVIHKIMPLQLQAVGVVEPFNTVAVRAQVAGEITAVHFREGQYVKAGDPLFTIDPRPYQALLKQMRANLARDKAQLENAVRQVERNASVVNKGYVSQEQYDKAMTNAATLKAAVQADEAAVETADLQLKYCFINSPIDGCTGAVQIDRGNLVKANDTENPLVVINQVSPIYVDFDIPQSDLAQIRTYMANGTLPVEAVAPGEKSLPAQGELTFLDNTVNPSTGTIRLKGTFPNPKRTLWPGQFVNVLLTLTTEPDACVIPTAAVQTGQQGSYVYVVKPDLTVEYREVHMERSAGNETVISKGLAAGEKVVMDGQLRLSPGALVKIAESGNKEAGGKTP